MLGGARRTGVHLPTFGPQEDRNEDDYEEIGELVNADTESSSNDVF